MIGPSSSGDVPVSRASRLLLLSVVFATAALGQVASDFEHPASTDTAQQFEADNVQRQDTPNDPDYDCAEPDTQSSRPCSQVYEERYDLFGFPSSLTRLTALYLDPNDPARFGQPQISGYNAAGAWKIERGRPEVSIAILDTGIKWDRCGLRTQLRLNAAELPLPRDASGATDPAAPLAGYDLDRNGKLDVDDYAADARVGRALEACEAAVTGLDLIRAFSNHDDADHNGYVDDIAGWNYFDDNNDPTDLSSYFAAGNHGTGRASDAVERGNDADRDLGVCPHCTFVPFRVWDTFVADANTFGLAILYAADNGIQVVEGADGALYHPAFTEAVVEYAHARGVTMTFSGNDLNTGNHNYPSGYNHVMLIEGTAADSEGLGSDSEEFQQARDFYCALPLAIACPGSNVPLLTYFRGANTTQFGGKSSISMQGATGSINTGKASGAAGLVISAGLDFTPLLPLSPDEVRAILEQTAEDVLPLNTIGAGFAELTQVGWDSHFGYGRANLGAAVQAVKDGNIPPEASIVTPDWYAPLTGASVSFTGVARARRADGGNFHYRFEWGPGLQPTSWTTIREGDASGTLTDLGTLELAPVRAAVAAFTVPFDPGDATFSPSSRHPLQDHFTVRLIVTDPDHPGNLHGEDRKVMTALPEGQNLSAGFPKRLGSGGEAPLRYADLDGDNVQELIVPVQDGTVHAYRPDGSELPGWPVMTQVFPQAAAHLAAPGFAGGGLPVPHEPPRAPTIADLDGDGHRQVVTAAGVRIYVFNEDGTQRAGFPVRGNPAFCLPSEQVQENKHPKCGFVATPSLARLHGPDQPMSIVVAAMDGRLYAWRGDGTPEAWSPVQLVDTALPEEERVVAESINNAAIGDLDGDGIDDIVVGTNEVYPGDSAVPGLPEIPGADDVGFGDLSTTSTRVYAINGATGALLPGWPVAVSGLIQNILPFIGPGQDAALAQIDGEQRILLSATGTGLPVLGSGLSTYGVDGVKVRAMLQDGKGPLSNITDVTGGLNLFESGVFAHLTGAPGEGLNVVKYQLGVSDVVNLLLVGQNMPYNHMIGAWDAASGLTLPAFPTITDDFQFLSASSVAKIVAGASNQVVAGTGLGLLHAYDGLTGLDVAGFPKVTGGWMFAPAAISDDGRIAAITREGFLYQWHVGQPACQSEWPSFRHDQQTSGNYDRDGTPPGAVAALAASRSGSGVDLRWLAPGDDGTCAATAAGSYRVLLDGVALDGITLAPAAPGTLQTLALPAVDAGVHRVVVQALDDAGNVGYPVSAVIAPPGTGALSGAVVALPTVNAQGAPGASVAAGGFTLVNNGSSAHGVSGVTLQVSAPGTFASLTLQGPDGSSVTVSSVASSTTFTFPAPLELAAGAQADFQLGGTLAPSDRAALGLFNSAYAADAPGGRTLPLAAMVLLLTTVALLRRQRRLALALLAGGLMLAGCHSSDPLGVSSPLPGQGSSSTIDLVAVAAQSGSSPVAYSGMPARLANVTRRAP